MTEELFREDAYLKQSEAHITAVDENGIQLDRTIFYAMGGGQPGDIGTLTSESGDVIEITDTRKADDGLGIVHLTEHPLSDTMIGQRVRCEIDWSRRHRLMRVHTLLHLLCSLIPAGVTGGSVRDGSGRLDFDLPESNLDKEQLTADLNRLIEEDHPVKALWITDEEMDAQPELVRTMSVSPPRGSGKVRLLEIDGVDLQPCGGTHVARTSEIGPVRVKKIEKKGKHNRRVTVELVDH
ncbi:MAG: alanyl-tRNA editing protein [Gammaproteobacteria bacterium]